MASSSSPGGEGYSYPETWIEWFCKQPGHSFFSEVEQAFIEDTFNLYGLANEVNRFQECLSIIIGGPPRTDRDGHSHPLYQDCKTLYGLIHARFILSSRGLSLMSDKLDDAVFGTCPRFLCDQTPVLPLGLHHEPGRAEVLLFCPRCEEVYHPPPGRSPCPRDLDGAYFGPTFPHLLLLGKPTSLPKTNDVYVPRIYGFRVASQKGRMGLADSSYATVPGASSRASGKGGELEDDEEMEDEDVGHGAGSRAGAGATVGTSALGTRGYVAPKAAAARLAAGSSAAPSTPTQSALPFRQGKPPLTSPYDEVRSSGAGAGHGSAGFVPHGHHGHVGGASTGTGSAGGYGGASGSQEGGVTRDGHGSAGASIAAASIANDDFLDDEDMPLQQQQHGAHGQGRVPVGHHSHQQQLQHGHNGAWAGHGGAAGSAGGRHSIGAAAASAAVPSSGRSSRDGRERIAQGQQGPGPGADIGTGSRLLPSVPALSSPAAGAGAAAGGASGLSPPPSKRRKGDGAASGEGSAAGSASRR